MPYYKDTSNKLHFIESEAFAYILPTDVVEITEAEALDLQEAAVLVMDAAPVIDPVEKLKSFLASNPDVAELLK